MGTDAISPAQVAIDTFGGCRKLARLLKKSPSSISRWKSRSGRIPSGEQSRILGLARSMRLSLSADDLIHGRQSGAKR